MNFQRLNFIKKVIKYLEYIEIDSDILIETRLYNTKLSTLNGIETEGNDNANLNDSTISITSCSSDTIPEESNNCQDSSELLRIE